MTAPRRIRLQGLVSAHEAAILSQAAERLGLALGAGYRVEAEFPAGVEALDRTAGPCIVLTSLLAEAEAIEEPWEDQEQRLNSLYGDLTADPHVIPYVCTVFRHVAETMDTDERRLRLGRIRRLNLLAPELSRRTGVTVVDLDRALADVGARALATDHRLGGEAAAAAAGACMAGVLLATGLDGVIPLHLHEAAFEALARLPAPTPGEEPTSSTAAAARPPPFRPRRSGAEAYARGVLRGELSLVEGAQALARTISRRGLWPALTLVFAGARRMLRAPASGRR